MGQKDIKAAVATDVQPSAGDTPLHLPLGILVCVAAVYRAAAKPQDPQTLVFNKLVVDTVAALGRIGFISQVVIAVHIKNRRAAHGDQKTEIICFQIAAGEDEIDPVQMTRTVIIPEIRILLVGKKKDLHSCTPSFSGGIDSR